MKPSELARAGAAGLRTWGWTRGPYGEENGPCCIVHALHRAGGDLWLGWGDVFAQTIDGLREVIGDLLVTQWNDRKCKSQDEAISVLETVAARFEERGL